MKKPGIYLDHHATTPVDPLVLEAMWPYFSEVFGNAASQSHRFGWEAQAAVDSAREKIARSIGAEPAEIIFTSGATESDNLAIKGAANYYEARGRHIVTTAIEHRAVLDSCLRLRERGFDLTVVAPGKDGVVAPEAIRQALTDQTILVSVMLANNEVGTIQPLEAIGEITKERGILLHTDAVQGVFRTPFNVQRLGVDLASLSAHKIYGPKGIGALYVRGKNPRVRVAAQMDGGGQERGYRSGTLNVPGIIGFAKACEIAQEERESDNARLAVLRDLLHQRLTEKLSDVTLNGHPERRVPGNLNLSFAGLESGQLIAALPSIALSTGSACSSASLEPSYVLRAMGVSDERARSSIRFGIGRFNDRAEIERAAEAIAVKVSELRSLAAV